jgi:hypothetical protein
MRGVLVIPLAWCVPLFFFFGLVICFGYLFWFSVLVFCYGSQFWFSVLVFCFGHLQCSGLLPWLCALVFWFGFSFDFMGWSWNLDMNDIMDVMDLW